MKSDTAYLEDKPTVELTGKCKEEFERWKHELYKEWVHNDKKGYENYGWSKFKELPLALQFGAYEDYAFSIGIKFGVYPVDFPLTNNFEYKVNTEQGFTIGKDQARRESVLLLDKLRNEQLMEK